MRPALVLCGLSLSACVPVVVPVPLPSPTLARGERANCELEPIERLGRFDGEGFRPVEPRSIPPSHLYVLVHGWAPGWGRAVVEDRSLRAWEARDARGRRFEPWMAALADAITDADPYAVVLAYSWLDDAATSRFMLAQRRAFAYTEVHGGVMKDALEIALARDFERLGGRTHLIGHSYGARVSVLAAIAMSSPPDHVTIFDSPDAPLTHITGSQSGLSQLLRELPIGVGRDRVFVDNYVSMVGAPYHQDPGLSGVVDVVLAPPYSSFDYRRRHLYPMYFYAQTARSDFGLGWSPLIAQAPAPGCYAQEYGRLALERGCPGLP